MTDLDWLVEQSAEFVHTGLEVAASQLGTGTAESASLILMLAVLGGVEVVGRQQL